MKIDGTYNFRDIGGTPLAAGGVIASGVLYRSDALSALSPTGQAQLAGTNTGVIIDLRTHGEQQMTPNRLPASREIRVVHLPLLEGALGGAPAGPAATADPDAVASALRVALAQLPTLAELYVSMLTSGAQAFADIARVVAAPALKRATEDAASGVLVHCTAGKDRTGVSVALLLGTVGAQREAIIQDYAASQQNLAGAWSEAMLAKVTRMGAPLSARMIELVTHTPASAITTALEWVDREHGGPAAYLRSGGLSETELDALHARLTA